MANVSETWGTKPQERELVFPCDRFICKPDAAVYRGISIHASPEVVFRWLCQMRVAPYSYDWIDNGGRQSPRKLTPGLDELAIGQEVMRIFDLVDFAQNEHMTLRLKLKGTAIKTFGDLAVSYLIVPGDHPSAAASLGIPGGEENCRLLVKLVVNYPPNLKGRLMRRFLPWGDLIMMRKQLLNLKQLAEESEL